ncbi:Concanavalin A-like lectin/glucanase, subgroup [Cynara cardunculus var. scolymus]|uniref:non-specific serine/threonine protein kinase n=1 Tax=Cynara cardunculus var. scolymus TaxID=59895 RepID=A0A124SHT4_CYNCS|nr:Concanavalin A-like lectin/glucanase, subgroup [Cynara cardunculus var. scolymus]
MSKQVSCLQDNVCATNSSSLYINCGGKQFEDGKKVYEADVERGGASHFSSTGSRWGFSNTGHFLGNGRDDYILPNPSRVLMNNSGLYESARTSALSLTYYGFCMRNGSYNVSLHFAEILLTDDGTYSSLGRRVFDIYIQGKLVEKDFDISDKAGGVGKAYVSTHSVNVTNTLEIRLYWAGKGTTNIPFQGVYGPLISAISVDPNYPVPPEDGLGNGHGVSRGVVAGIVVGSVCCIVVILGVLWWWGYLRHRDTIDLELTGVTGSFTLRQIKAATNNFDVANKIGEGGFGSVYKGVLPDGTLIAVKQLSSKSRQGNREFLNELGMISALQHPHLVKLHGCCIEGNQLLLAGYMAPEYALRGYLTDKADVYSYGIVLLEIVSGAIALKNGGNLMELVDPRLGSDYDVQEATVVINLALLCTTISPTDRPAMSAVVSMLEGRTVARAFDVEQSVATTEVDREKMMKQLECMNESRIEEMSIARTDS